MGKRAGGLTMLGVWVNPEVVEHIDAARGPLSRSQFLRAALADVIKAAGVDVVDSEFYAPDRSAAAEKVRKATQTPAATLGDSITQGVVSGAKSLPSSVANPNVNGVKITTQPPDEKSTPKVKRRAAKRR